MQRRLLPLALLALLAGCASAPPAGSSGVSDGVLIVTSGGAQLYDGDATVPPTLDLQVTGDGISRDLVRVSLDGRRVTLSAAANGVSARVAAMAYGSSHTLDVAVQGRPAQSFAFRVVGRTQVSAAAWLAPGAALVCQVVFEYAPAHAPLAAALPGAHLTWIDPTHLSLSWTAAPPALTIPRGLPAEWGSVLDGPLSLPLSGLRQGQLRRATVPAPPAAPRTLPLTLWSVGTAASHASVAAHAPAVAVLSPAGWEVEPDGSLSDSPDAATLAAAAAAHRPVWPLVANISTGAAGTDQLLHDPGAESALVAGLALQVRRLGLGGINLDFEAVPGSDRAELTAFVRQLAGALHAAGAGLSVDVVPHAPGAVNAASAAYDYPALAAAADQLVVMAYDEHYAAGDPGPIAGVDWQAAELAGTLPGVPHSKVVLGIPLYARIWSGSTVTASDYASAVAEALSQPDAAYGYDFAAQTPELSSDPGGQPTQLWFDDAQSLLYKIAAVQRLGLDGIAAWRAGFEDPAFWSVL